MDGRYSAMIVSVCPWWRHWEVRKAEKVMREVSRRLNWMKVEQQQQEEEEKKESQEVRMRREES